MLIPVVVVAHCELVTGCVLAAFSAADILLIFVGVVSRDENLSKPFLGHFLVKRIATPIKSMERDTEKWPRRT
jgi:hypothetical protein